MLEIQTLVPDPAIAQFRDQIRFWIQRVAVPVLMVIGLFGNSITIIIMTRRGMRSTTNLYLAALAFVDILYLVLTFLLGLSHYPNMAARKYYLYWRVRPFLMMLTDACSNTSVWLTVTFTIERFIAVKYPMKGKVWCTEARAKMLILGIFIFGVLFASPVPFEWEVVEQHITTKLKENGLKENNSNVSLQTIANKTNIPIDLEKSSIQDEDSIEDSWLMGLEYSNFGKNETYKRIYYSSTAVLFSIVPFLLLMFFNGFLIKSVHQSKRERTEMTRGTASRSDSQVQCNRNHIVIPKVVVDLTMNGGSNKNLIISTSSAREVSNESHLDEPLLKSKSQQTKSPPSSTKDEDSLRRTFSEEEPTSKDLMSYSEATMSLEESSDSAVQSKCDTESKNDQPDFLGTNTNVKNGKNLRISTTNPPSTSNRLTSTIIGSRGRGKKGSCQYNSQTPIMPASTQERRITIMLISVVILFLICQMPSAAMVLYTSARQTIPNTNEHEIVLACGNIFNFLMAVNAAGNFILYSFLSKKYRKTFMKLFCSCSNATKKESIRPQKLFSIRSVGQSIRKNTTIFQINKPNDKKRQDTLV